RPRARRLLVLLVAVREVDERAGAAIEAVRLCELRARLGVFLLLDELLRVDEERLGGGLVAPGPCGDGREDDRSDERAGDDERSHPHPAMVRDFGLATADVAEVVGRRARRLRLVPACGLRG